MLKKFLKKKNNRQFFFKKLTILYTKYLLDFYFIYKTTIYRSIIENNVPKRQHYLSVTKDNKSHVFSSGYVIASQSIKLKYYKRSSKSNTGLILHIQKLYKENSKYIYLYRCLNFSYRQLVFLQKYWKLVSPEILYFQHKKSYNINYSPVKSIKKRVTKLLNKIT